MQARQHFIQLGIPGGHPLDAAVVLHQLLDLFKGADQHRLDGLQLLAALAHGDVVDGLFRALQDLLVLLLASIAVLEDLVGGGDQAAQGGLFIDDAYVSLYIGGGGHLLGQLHQIGRAAHGVQLPPPGQLGVEGHQVHWARLIGHVLHGREDLPVGGIIEIRRAQALDGQLGRLPRPDHGAQYAALRFRVVGRCARHVRLRYVLLHSFSLVMQ